MKGCIAVMPSYTYAVKGCRLLSARGFGCTVVRTASDSHGCGYSLRISGNCRMAAEVLRSYAVPCSSFLSGGDDDDS